MKTFLVILLFALTTCEFPAELVKVAKCVVQSQKVKEYLPKLVTAIQDGDVETLLTLGLTAFKEVKEEVKECIDEPVLKYTSCKQIALYRICIRDCAQNPRDLCDDICYLQYCN